MMERTKKLWALAYTDPMLYFALMAIVKAYNNRRSKVAVKELLDMSNEMFRSIYEQPEGPYDYRHHQLFMYKHSQVEKYLLPETVKWWVKVLGYEHKCCKECGEPLAFHETFITNLCQSCRWYDEEEDED